MNLSIRNNLCFSELHTFNKDGKFLGKHPFVMKDKEREEIKEQLFTSQEIFLNETRLLDKNIARYTGYLKSDKYNEAQKASFKETLIKYENRKKLYAEILRESLYGGK